MHLKGNRKTVAQRMAHRDGHFMPTSLIESQFDTLESPTNEWNVIELDIEKDLATLCEAVRNTVELATEPLGREVDFRLKPHLGLIGLGVMGQNLAQNIVDKGYALQSWDIDEELRRNYVQIVGVQNERVKCHDSLEALIRDTESPRSLLLMIKAGSAVDDVLTRLLPLLNQGDLVVDLGNSHYEDTDRRFALAKKQGIRFMGCGVSGGAKGARWGPALMPGGDLNGGRMLQGLFADIAASYKGDPCVNWIGPEGAGHFVKMVHNGIEYADMQLICEAYHIMRDGLKMQSGQIANTFSRWNDGPLESYLIQATANIFTAVEPDGTALVERILDRAGQKGTGGWAVGTALEYGVPVTQMSGAVFARIVSSLKADRQRYAKAFDTPDQLIPDEANREVILDNMAKGLYCAKVINYIQGFMLMREVSAQRGWGLSLMQIASTWRAGCIIRGELLLDIVDACRNPEVDLLDAPKFKQVLRGNQGALRKVVRFGVDSGIPLPNFTGALTFFDSIRSASLPANLIQAQRDYFGAHRFERVDQPMGQLFHANWDELVANAAGQQPSDA